MFTEEATQAVQKLALHFDKVYPGWANKIDTDKLNLEYFTPEDETGECCILSQLFSSKERRFYSEAYFSLHDAEKAMQLENEELNYSYWNISGDVLADNKYKPLWLEEIAKRIYPTNSRIH